MVLYCCNVFHSTLLEIQIVLLLILSHQSDTNEIITTSAFSFDLEKSSARRNHYCPAGGKIDHAMVARIVRWGRLGHQLCQMQSGMKTSMVAMHDNVEFMLVKLRLKDDICPMWHWTC